MHPSISGNSGGPLLNALGQVIGRTPLSLRVAPATDSLGFAIPSNRVVRIEQLGDSGKVSRFDLGMDLRNISFNDARRYYLPYVNNGNGVFVFSVNTTVKRCAGMCLATSSGNWNQ